MLLAQVLAHRRDKPAAQADMIETVHRLHAARAAGEGGPGQAV